MAIAALTGNATAQSKTASALLASGAFSAAVAVGSIVYVVLAADNTSTGADGDNGEVTSVTDTESNTYAKVKEWTNTQAGAGNGATISLWKSKIATALTTSDTVTANFASRTAKVIIAAAFSVAAGNDLRVAGTIQTAATDAASLPAQTISGLTSKEYLFIRVSAIETPAATTTPGTNYASLGAGSGSTAGGSSVTNMSLLAAYRIFTGTGDSNNATYGASLDSASIYVAFEEYTPTAPARKPQGHAFFLC